MYAYVRIYVHVSTRVQMYSMYTCTYNRSRILIRYALKFSRGSIFAVFMDRKSSVKGYTRENLDQALVQWQNMAVQEHKNEKFTKSHNPLISI